MQCNGVSKTVYERLPLYLHYLRGLPRDGAQTVSSVAIARALQLGEVQVRKDLSAVSGIGKPKIGYVTQNLIGRLECFLGCNSPTGAVLVGAGKLGSALLEYDGFSEYGLCISAVFDRDDCRVGGTVAGKPVLPMSELAEHCGREHIQIGILAVQEKYAQQMCAQMVQSGILAIWNLAPIKLNVPSTVIVKNENMASSLAVLSAQLKSRTVEMT